MFSNESCISKAELILTLTWYINNLVKSSSLTATPSIGLYWLHFPWRWQYPFTFLASTLECIHLPPSSWFLYALFAHSLVQLLVVEMNYVRSPEMYSDFLQPICSILDTVHYFIWSLPLPIEFVCLTQFQLWSVVLHLITSLIHHVFYTLVICIFVPMLCYLQALPHIMIGSF